MLHRHGLSALESVELSKTQLKNKTWRVQSLGIKIWSFGVWGSHNYTERERHTHTQTNATKLRHIIPTRHWGLGFGFSGMLKESGFRALGLQGLGKPFLQ